MITAGSLKRATDRSFAVSSAIAAAVCCVHMYAYAKRYVYLVVSVTLCSAPITASTMFGESILKTSAVSSTNLGSIFIFASCVVGTCLDIYVLGPFLRRLRGR